MLGIFKRQKICEAELADSFVNAFLPTVYSGFPDIAALINESPEFTQSPAISQEDVDRFLLVCLAGNTMAIQQLFSSRHDQTLIREVIERVAEKGGVEYSPLVNAVSNYEKFISKVNHPSKNIIYGMSKAVFYKYDLSPFQEEYFRKLNSPNPILLKRLDEVMDLFLWHWEEHSDR